MAMSQEDDTIDFNGSQKPADTESDREQIFNQFCEITDFQEIQKSFQALCEAIGVKPNEREGLPLYESLKKELTSWKCLEVWKLLDARALLPEYAGQKACEGMRVLIVGAGPVGLRAAIEAALLGAKVDLVEKRTSFSRNNSLHLWPFVITDLRRLGAKKFYGKFCAGAIDHVSIRILQSILLKVTLLLGVNVHSGIKFTGLVEPKNTNSGWTVTVSPTSSAVSCQNFDVIVAADGKQHSLPGFRSKEFRAKLALAITVNFVNHNTKQESSVPEISGVSYVYNQQFFDTLAEKHGIDLENIVYYKDETHYFVMTAKKRSLLKKKVLKMDYNDPKQLLSPDNINHKSLEQYAIEAVMFSTEEALGSLEFEKNHRGENDVALFDFTSLFAAENASRIVQRKGRKILVCLAGDSLLEPFWPTGTGCARGFLGAFDAAWMIKGFAAGTDPIALLEEREAILYLLPQTTPERLNKSLTGYTIDPKTRYLTLNEITPPGDVTHLFDTDDPTAISNRVPSSNQKAAKAAKQQDNEPTQPTAATVAATKPVHMSRPPVRSKSTEDLAPPAPAKPAASRHSPKIWKKKDSQTVKVSPSPSPRASPQLPRSKVGSGSKSSPGAKVRQERGSTGATDKNRASPGPKGKEPGGTETKNASPMRTSSSKLAKKEEKRSDVSPKPTNKEPTASKQPTTEPKKDLSASHPPTVVTVVEGSPKAVSKSKAEPQLKVADIVKQLEPSSPGAAVASPGKRKESVKQKPPGKDNKKKEEKKKEEKVKGKPDKDSKKQKEKEKSEKERDREKEAKGKDSASHPPQKRGFFASLFRSKKSYDVVATEAAAGLPAAKSPKHKRKSKKEGKQKPPPPEEQEPKPLTIQSRIEQLKQRGFATESPDAQEEALLAAELEEGEQGRDEGVPERSSSPLDTITPPQSPVEGEQGLPEDNQMGGEAESGVELENVMRELLPSPPVEEEGEEQKATVVETVRRLQPFFEASTAEPSWKRATSVRDRRSKEIDLAEIYSRESKEETSHPLWLARVMQGLNKCLERLKKQNDITVSKTALEILNTIFSNVQVYPDDDTYRRVRISSKRFHDKVWQYSDASQFLARSGWVEIDDFIVLPIGKKVDIPKRVLDKHLDIVNQMLWSMQLELPDSPEVLRRVRENRLGKRSTSLNRRESYASRIVTESLERVEKDKRAMVAAKMKKQSSTGSLSPTSPVGLQPLPEVSEREEEEEEQEEGEKDASPNPVDPASVREDRAEELQTMKAASAARNIWMRRDRRGSEKARWEKEYRVVLETELYDLAPGKVEPRSKLPREEEEEERCSRSPQQMEASVILRRREEGGEVEEEERAVGEDRKSQRRLSQQEILEATVVASENARQVWKQLSDSATNGGRDVTTPPREPTPERQTSSTSGSGGQPSHTNSLSSSPLPPSQPLSPSPLPPSQPLSPSPLPPSQPLSPSPLPPSEPLSPSPLPPSQPLSPSPLPPSQSVSPSSLPPSQPLSPSPSPLPPSQPPPLSPVGAISIGPSGTSSPEVTRPETAADVQSATESSIKSGRLQYERITIEAAAQVRQKWMEGNVKPQD